MNELDDNLTTAERFKSLRKQAGMTQVEFADYLGLPIRTIRSWEQDTRNPSKGVENIIRRLLMAENIIPCPSPLDKIPGSKIDQQGK